MASVEQQASEQVAVNGTNGNGSAGSIPVENPAHRRGHRARPGPRCRGGSRDGRARARTCSPAGRRSASRAARRSSSAPRSGSWTTQDRIIDTIVSETGKTYEDAQLAEISYGAHAFGFWAKNAPKYLADEKVSSSQLFVEGQEAHRPLAPARRHRRDRPVELPADELVRRLHPGARRRQRRDPQAERDHAAHVAADGRVPARSAACPKDVYQVATGRGGTGARADRRGGHDHVHRLDADRQEGRDGRGRAAHPRRRWSSAARTR